MKSFVGRSVFLFQSWDHHFEMLESTVALGMLPIITTLKSSRVPSRCSRLLQWNIPCALASASAKLIYHRENKRAHTSIALSGGVSHLYDERGRSQITDRFWSEFTHTGPNSASESCPKGDETICIRRQYLSYVSWKDPRLILMTRPNVPIHPNHLPKIRHARANNLV